MTDGVPAPALAAALLSLDLEDSRVRPWWAAHWVAEGLGGPRTAELAGLRGDEPEAADLWPRALAELGVAHPVVTPRSVAAAWVAQQVVAGRRDERWLVRALWPDEGWGVGDGDSEADGVVYALDDLLDRAHVDADHPPRRRRVREREDERRRECRALADAVVGAMASGGLAAAAVVLESAEPVR